MSRGCIELDSNVNKLGAAAFHPEMLKQVVASDCCRLCCIQSTFRPYDSDCGLSHSLQHCFQCQVIIKPFYGLAGRLCLSSLECLGYVSSLYKLTESDWVRLGRGLRMCSEFSGSVADNSFRTNVRNKMCACRKLTAWSVWFARARA